MIAVQERSYSLKYHHKNKHKKEYKEKRAKYFRDYLQKNKERFKNYRDKRQHIMIEYVKNLKNKPCMDCLKIYNPWQMHFDHREPEMKKNNIAWLVWNGNTAMNTLQIELDKCDLVCANCHADRTHRRKNNE